MADSEQAPDGLPFPRRTVAIAAISLGTSLFVVDGTIANVALPTIARDLGVGDGAVVSIVTTYQLILVMCLLPFGNLADRVGHRTLYQIGQVIFMVASGLALFAHTLPELLVVRGAQALGAGMALSVSSAILRNIYPSKRLGSGLGINSVIVSSSSAIAPTLGGFIVAQFDWRWMFVAAVPLALLSLLVGRSLPDPEPRDTPFDWRGGVLSAAMFGLIIGGLEYGVHGGVGPGTIALIIGVVMGILFYRRERTRPRPVLPVDLLAIRVIGLSVLGAIAMFLASTSLIVILPFRLEQGMGYSPAEVGLLILPLPLTMLVVSPVAGWLSDRVQPSLLGMIGMGLAIAGLIAVALLPPDAGWMNIAWRLSLSAAGFGLFLAPNSRLIIGKAPRDRAAAAGGLLSTARLLGQTLGASTIGILLAVNLGLTAIPMLIAISLCIVAASCSLVRLRTT